MKSIIFICLAMLCLVAGCSSPESGWSDARVENTIEAYENFISEYPGSIYADSAQALIINLRFRQAEYLNTVKAYEDLIPKLPDDVLKDSAQNAIEKIHYLIACSENTMPAYNEYIRNNPGGKYVDLARSRIERILSETHPSLRNVRDIKLRTKLLNKSGQYVVSGVNRISKALFNFAGIKLITEDSIKCDAELILALNGHALGGSYMAMQGNLGGYHYTGAEVLIQFKLKKNGREIANRTFRGLRPRRQYISSSYKKPSSAPWSGAINEAGFSNGVITILGKLLGKSFMTNVLFKYGRNDKDTLLAEYFLKNHNLTLKSLALEALNKYDWKIRNSAVAILKKYSGLDTERPLLNILKYDNDSRVRFSASEALNEYAKNCPLDTLLNMLALQNYMERRAGALLLARRRDYRSIAPLIDLLSDKNNEVQSAAETALKNITRVTFYRGSAYRHADIDKKIRYWKKWWKKNKEKVVAKNNGSSI